MPPLRSIFTLAIACLGSMVFGQQAPGYETISTAQGLSQGMVFAMLQDREGFLWVATKNGLNRYDGYNFSVYTNDPYNSNSLSSNTVTALFEDSKGRIWAGTDLKDLSNSIGSVAMDCGYGDPGYFARVFKQEYGITPQEWRENNKLPYLE